MAQAQELNVETYAALERHALASLSNDHIRAFSPATFTFHGYPAAAESDAAVRRYVDTMQELNDPRRYHQTEVYSPAEAELVERVNSAVVAETKQTFGRAIRPWMGPLVAIKMFRAIQVVAAAAGKERLRIFEIGPGSGYLGALLIAQGHQYYSTDIAQGFYLWQSRLMRAIAPSDFFEGALREHWPYETSARAIHMPWWHYAALYRATPPAMDIVICDHALGEMNPYALRYVSQMSRNMLSDSPLGLVMFTSVGEPRFNNDHTVHLNFLRVGMGRFVEKNVVVFAMSDRVLDPRILALSDDVPIYNPSGTSERLRGADFVPIRRNEAPVSYELYAFLGYDGPDSPLEPVATSTHSGNGRSENNDAPGVENKSSTGPENEDAFRIEGKGSPGVENQDSPSAETKDTPRRENEVASGPSDDTHVALNDVLKAAPPLSSTKRLRDIVGKTRERGLGWVVERVREIGVRPFLH